MRLLQNQQESALKYRYEIGHTRIQMGKGRQRRAELICVHMELKKVLYKRRPERRRASA